MKTIKVVALAVSLLLSGFSVAKAEFPDRPIKLVVGYSPGGAMDTLARRLAESWSAVLKQPVLVDNKPGASGSVAAVTVAKAKPDGYTLMFGENAQLIAPHLQSRLGQAPTVDPFGDFVPVGGVATSVLAIAVSKDFPASDMAEFINAVKNGDKQYFYATSGVGSVHHLGMESIMQSLGFKLEHVPYKGASQILPDLISGNQIQIGVVSTAAAREFVNAGQLKFVGILAGPRVASLPDISSFSEVMTGYAAAVPRMYILAPQGTPPDIVAKLGQTLEEALKSSELVTAYQQVDSFPNFSTPEDLRQQMQKESAAWAETVKNVELSSS